MSTPQDDDLKDNENRDAQGNILRRKPKANLKERWKAFGGIVCYPEVVFFLISTLILSVVLIGQTDTIIISIFTFLVSLFSGILGGIIAKRWDDITEEKLIEARGKSANRSLQLLLSSVISLERRVRIYLQRFNDKKYQKQVTPEVIKTYLEEIIEESLSLEEKVIKSIEDWTDILPYLEVKTVLNYIRELKINYSDTLKKLEQVDNALQETKGKSEAEINKLKGDKNSLTKELFRIRKELRKHSDQVGVPTISGSLITGDTDSPLFPASFNPWLGKQYTTLDLETPCIDGIQATLPENAEGITTIDSDKKDIK